MKKEFVFVLVALLSPSSIAASSIFNDALDETSRVIIRQSFYLNRGADKESQLELQAADLLGIR